MLKNTPWLKSMLFWIVLVSIIFLIFRCSTRQEQEKIASSNSYERLYDCMSKIPSQQQGAWFQHIQQRLSTQLNQKQMIELIRQCQSHKVGQNEQQWIEKIKQL